MGQHHFNALGLGLEGNEPQQRVEPDQAASGAMPPVHLEFQPGIRFALQSIGNQQHNGALPEHAAAPLVVGIMQRGRDPRPARQVLDAG